MHVILPEHLPDRDTLCPYIAAAGGAPCDPCCGFACAENMQELYSRRVLRSYRHTISG